MLLHGLLGLTEEDTAQALGVNQSTVSRVYSRALEVLAADLNGSDESE